jgi:hypothetical protein
MFENIKAQVATRFKDFDSTNLLLAAVDRGVLFDAYLAALPEEERQPHNCACCRSFLNRYGNLVSIKDGKVLTLWDFEGSGVYADVPKALARIVKAASIRHPLVTAQSVVGTDFNLTEKAGKAVRFVHFSLKLPRHAVTDDRRTVAKDRGALVSTHQVFSRGLDTITLKACKDVLKLIEGGLYRGAQFKAQVEEFLTYKEKYDELTDKKKQLFGWEFYKKGGRIRNSSIGTLLVDLSEGVPKDRAVKSYETKVDPNNYMHSSAPVSTSQVANARKHFEEHGLMPSLERRHATPDDIPLEHLLFVHRATSKPNAFDEIAASVKVDPKSFAKAPELTLDAFLTDVLPTAERIELYVDTNHNMVSLIAPEYKDAPNILKWPNAMSWTYANNLTDSIAERVKAKGGNADAELRISLDWHNFDDLDLHVIEPNGNEIWFRNPRSDSSCGYLDIDENRSPNTRTPVENIAFAKGGKIQEGKYTAKVHNWSKRENVDVGFTVQVACRDQSSNFNYDRAVRQDETIKAVAFNYSRKDGVTNFVSDLRNSTTSVENVGSFQKVNMIMNSPNYWESETGNKHMFFILDGATINTELRPFFNEYLDASLLEHRKFLEQLGSKYMVQPAASQVSGVGFSLTQNYNIVVKVNGKPFRISI